MATTAPLLQPLFTNSPLDSSFGCHYSDSPVSTYDGHCRSPCSPKSDVRLDDDCETLTFRKVALPCYSATPSAFSTSTDSEAVVSDSNQISGSPSLLTSLFISQRQQSCSSSRNPSTSGSSQPTPITPASSSPRGCRPILRNTSASTSPSDDNHTGGVWRPKPLASVFEQQQPCPTLFSRRSCLKFAVAHPTLSNPSPPTGRERPCRSPAPVPVWADIPCPLPVDLEDHSDDDEGYVEDEEDGFDSDEEDFVSTFAGSSRHQIWESRFPAFTPFQRPIHDDEESRPASPTQPPAISSRPTRPERKISIAGNCIDRCPRHLSPPPPEFSSTLEIPSAPPAARSPSAAEFCRRKQSATPKLRKDRNQSCLPLNPGWRSDDTGFTLGRATPSSIDGRRKASLPDTASRSILRITTTPCSPETEVRSRSNGPSFHRRDTEPARSRSCGARVDNSFVMSSSRATCESAKSGLERALQGVSSRRQS